MYTLLLYSLLSAAMFYLGSRAKITKWLWSRYPPSFDAFMACPACTGFWWGLILHVTIGRRYDLSYLALDTDLISSLVVGLCSIVMTPITAGIMLAGIDQVGMVAPADTAPPPEPPSDG